MKTEVLRVDALRPEGAAIARAAAVLGRGGLVAFPTETVYGLGALALEPTVVAKIFAAKGRPATNPLIVHIHTIAAARALVAEWPVAAERLAERFWPGPLTLVLPRQAHVPDLVTAGGETVAVRMPAHAVARALIEAVGAPLAAPSANASTRISPTTAEHVLRTLDGRVDLVLDGGATAGGIESTVIDLSRGQPRLLRPGLVTVEQLEAVLGESVDVMAGPVDESATMPAPGMMARHYAPLVPVELLATGDTARVLQLSATSDAIGWLTYGEAEDANVAALPANVMRLQLPAHPAGYAAELYAALHTFEAAGVSRIIIALPPTSAPWSAIHDRLTRAGSAK